MKSQKNKAPKTTATPTDTKVRPNEKFPFGIKFTGATGNIAWERYKTAKERDFRLAGLKTDEKAEPVNAIATAVKPPVTGAPKARATKAPATPKAPKAPATTKGDALTIHVNRTGRVCFGKDAAARLGDAKHVLLAIDKGVIRLQPTSKATENSLPVRDASGRRYVSATRQFKPLGFDGSRAMDIEARPYGAAGFEFRLA